MKLFVYFSFSFIICHCTSQLLTYPSLPANNKILFIGEAHRIEENSIIQLDLIKHYVEKEGYNTVILELSSSYQYIIDNMINKGDTTNLHLLLPIVICNKELCNHNLQPRLNFYVNLAHFAREKEIQIHCIDVELSFRKVQKVFISILETDSLLRSESDKITSKLRTLSKEIEIQSELLNLYENKKSIKNAITAEAFYYVNNILDNVYAQRDRKTSRDENMYNEIHKLARTNKSFKAVTVNGLAHVGKVDFIDNNSLRSKRNSVSTMLNSNKKSSFKNKISSIALAYFFEFQSDSSYSNFGYFKDEDMKLLKEQLGVKKYWISKTSEIGLSSFVQKAYDYVISINDARMLMDHSKPGN